MSTNRNAGASASRSTTSRPDPIAHVSIIIPARDEAATILQTLDSVDDARRHLLARVTSSCVVVLDDCTDGTEALLRRRLRRQHDCSTLVVSCDARNVGTARAVGTAAAVDDARRREVPLSSTWLASTDADTTVPPHWLHAQLQLADQGIDALTGTVELERHSDQPLRDRFNEAYVLGADGSHRHVHGANMAMRADTYLAAGGWRSLPCGEDHDLWNRLRNVGNCATSSSFAVTTSARLSGRAPDGFAADLAALRRVESVA